jgi:UDP-glucose 4-epimerase
LRILFTGSSSFTGYWFIRSLIEGGHDVVATFAGPGVDAYGGIRRARVSGILQSCRCEFDAPFGSDRFLRLLGSSSWDVLCHHSAEVREYRNPLFDIMGAVGLNTLNSRDVLGILRQSGASRVIITGSVFEEGEGIGSGGLKAFSPYGVSKGLSAAIFRYYATELGVPLGKFVIPNPFGPFEEPRFTAYLMKCWLGDAVAEVRTPLYARDNIHVRLLAIRYREFVQAEATGPYSSAHPSGYVENQGMFTRRLSEAISARTGRACRFTLGRQDVFDEPMIRANFEPTTELLNEIGEESLFTEFAEWYLNYGKACQ